MYEQIYTYYIFQNPLRSDYSRVYREWSVYTIKEEEMMAAKMCFFIEPKYKYISVLLFRKLCVCNQYNEFLIDINTDI